MKKDSYSAGKGATDTDESDFGEIDETLLWRDWSLESYLRDNEGKSRPIKYRPIKWNIFTVGRDVDGRFQILPKSKDTRVDFEPVWDCLSAQQVLYGIVKIFGLPHFLSKNDTESPDEDDDDIKETWWLTLRHSDGSDLKLCDGKGGACFTFFGTQEASSQALEMLDRFGCCQPEGAADEQIEWLERMSSMPFPEGMEQVGCRATDPFSRKMKEGCFARASQFRQMFKILKGKRKKARYTECNEVSGISVELLFYRLVILFGLHNFSMRNSWELELRSPHGDPVRFCEKEKIGHVDVVGNGLDDDVKDLLSFLTSITFLHPYDGTVSGLNS